MSDRSSNHTALTISLKFALNVALVFALAVYLPQYFGVTGGYVAYVIIGALISLLNIFFRPFLSVLLLPLKFVATIIAVIVVNGVYVYVVQLISQYMDSTLVTLQIYGGPWGWIVISLCFGLANWVMKEMFK